MTTASAHVACCASILALARRGEGLKGQSCSTSGTTMEARTIQTQKKRKRKSATFSKSNVSWQEEPARLQSIVAAPMYCKVEHKELKKKRKILSIDHQASRQRQLCGVSSQVLVFSECHKRCRCRAESLQRATLSRVILVMKHNSWIH